MNNEHVFTLTDAERAQAHDVAQALVDTPPHLVDEEPWVSASRTLSCRLPRRLRERLREFRQDPGMNGILLLRNLPEGARLAPTPTVPGSVEREATIGGAVISMVSMQLGEVIAYRNEKSGALVQNVVPVPGKESQQSNAGSTPLEMHVENAFHPHRPDFVGLLCVRSDHDRVAGLQVASVRQAAAELSHDARKVLGEPRFATEAPPSFGDPEGGELRHAVLTGDFDDPDVQVDFHATCALDDQAGEALDVLRDAIVSVARTLVLEPGDLALVDNRVTLHGRTHFTPRYDGEDRWLYRTFVHLDHRRSRALRAVDGHVLA